MRKLSAVQRYKPALGNPINTKLGPGIHTWSIPAEETCPGATEACLSCCYARRGFFLMPSIERRLWANYRFSQTAEFTAWMVSAVQAQWVRVMRVHVSGDLYDAAYTEKWLEIVAKTARVRYFLYTRSWREHEILPLIRKLAKRPNVALWLSADVETGRPPAVAGSRGVSWMARDTSEEDQTPKWANLVFRNTSKTLRKKVNGVQVCPNEIGLPATYPRLTCTQCQLCFRSQTQGVSHVTLQRPVSLRND